MLTGAERQSKQGRAKNTSARDLHEAHSIRKPPLRGKQQALKLHISVVPHVVDWRPFANDRALR